MFFTKSHHDAHETMTILGRLFFRHQVGLPLIKSRLFPLVVGPTGVGKSHLVEKTAADLQAHYFKVTRGDWLPQGVKSGRPTVYQIIDQALTHQRVLLHIDELDKFQINFAAGDWGASIGSDLWNLLDGKHPFEGYLSETPYPEGQQPSSEALSKAVQRSLWIVGSGTWQDIFANNRRGATMGFQGSMVDVAVDVQTIARSGVIPVELLHRFSGDLLFLEYPSPCETAILLTTSGLADLAKKAGVTITPDQIDWTQGGMRALETLATRLAVAYYRLTEIEPLNALMVEKRGRGIRPVSEPRRK